MTIQGEIVGLERRSDGGTECTTVRTEDGRLFAVIGPLDRDELGDTVEISGPLALWSTCQTFQVIRADRISSQPVS